MKYLLLVVLFAIATTGATFEATTSNARTSATMSVTATVTSNCVLRSPIALDFGKYDASQGGGPLDATANVLSIACTKGAPGVHIALDNGQNYGGAHRNLAGEHASDKVGYEIYTGPDHATVWNLVQTVAYVPANSQLTAVPMYGRVLGGQTPHAGHYSDTLLAMVNF